MFLNKTVLHSFLKDWCSHKGASNTRTCFFRCLTSLEQWVSYVSLERCVSWTMCPLDNASLTDVSRPWTVNKRWIITAATQRNLGYPGSPFDLPITPFLFCLSGLYNMYFYHNKSEEVCYQWDRRLESFEPDRRPSQLGWRRLKALREMDRVGSSNVKPTFFQDRNLSFCCFCSKKYIRFWNKILDRNKTFSISTR